MRASTYLKQLALILVALLAFSLVVNQQASLLYLWAEQVGWTALAALFICALIAWRFGRSRLVYLSAMQGIIVAYGLFNANATHTLVGQLELLTLVFCGWLVWRPDKGLQPRNALLTLLELGLMTAVLGYFYSEIDMQLSQFAATPFTALLTLFPHLAEWITAAELCLFLMLGLAILIRWLLLPSNLHSVMLVSMLIGMSSYLLHDTLITQFSALFIATLFGYAILADSFTMAFRDELTTIPSRRALMQYIQTLGRRYVVVMGDVDHFKKFNDTYGHDVGDQVLKLVAAQLNKVSGGGKAFRYGGEEFTLVFPNKKAQEAKVFVEVLREAIANYPIVLRGKDRPNKTPPKKQIKHARGNAVNTQQDTVSVTCSFGVAEKTSEHKDFMAVMKQADIALYAAKQAGRNCVQIAG